MSTSRRIIRIVRNLDDVEVGLIRRELKLPPTEEPTTLQLQDWMHRTIGKRLMELGVRDTQVQAQVVDIASGLDEKRKVAKHVPVEGEMVTLACPVDYTDAQLEWRIAVVPGDLEVGPDTLMNLLKESPVFTGDAELPEDAKQELRRLTGKKRLRIKYQFAVDKTWGEMISDRPEVDNMDITARWKLMTKELVKNRKGK